MTLPITAALAAAILAVLQIILMFPVGNMRRAKNIPFGDGGDAELLRLSRRHGNFIENAPMFLILLTLLELIGGSTMTVTALAGLFVVARLSHAIALSSDNGPLVFRVVGALGTIISLLATAGFLAYQVTSGM
ncbi:MAG: MAPEG family protein [Kordiimonadaceae bacterium]|nr:MAPEG family protein [Kordiimonadaceae bacterium]MBO6570449.1 MAPEG family protein [Kordiimonadaceae bacterium]MBO6966432.1 MAPEG family protein [Kordiimonadaceae bacterium]